VYFSFVWFVYVPMCPPPCPTQYIFHTPMTRYSLSVLKVSLNTNKPTNQPIVSVFLIRLAPYLFNNPRIWRYVVFCLEVHQPEVITLRVPVSHLHIYWQLNAEQQLRDRTLKKRKTTPTLGEQNFLWNVQNCTRK